MNDDRENRCGRSRDIACRTTEGVFGSVLICDVMKKKNHGSSSGSLGYRYPKTSIDD